ncbi:hypothetical protein RGQ13_19540 [Thalassotalea psychrophila]|uniref:Outer membrane protein beta-barrel domain-containing protein n=1 Tax=Thalassotalea psychrophila TaxID=3065647 RepID=A0ABY9TTX2_9GAMM|nr:hypothetical protein RGQ13_19540 [Colwelliaceae bacterium SQ149]
MKKTLIILSFIFIAVTALFLMPERPPIKADKVFVKQVPTTKNQKTNATSKNIENSKDNNSNDTIETAVKDKTILNEAPDGKPNVDGVLPVQKINYRHQKQYFKNQRNIFALNNRSDEEKAIDALQFNPYWGLEADYANLKGAHKGQDAVLDEASEVRFRDSAESSAIMINIIGSVPLTEKSSFFAKVGLNNWEIEESQANALSANQRPVYGQPGMNSDLDGGTDMFYGIGFKYDYDSFILKSEMQVFEINGEEHEVFTIGGDFKF